MQTLSRGKIFRVERPSDTGKGSPPPPLSMYREKVQHMSSKEREAGGRRRAAKGGRRSLKTELRPTLHQLGGGSQLCSSVQAHQNHAIYPNPTVLSPFFCLPASSPKSPLEVPLAGAVHSHQLDVDQQRLVDEALVEEHKVECALSREGLGLGTDPVVLGVRVRIPELRWNDDLPNAALLHRRHGLLERRYDGVSALHPPEKVLVLLKRAALDLVLCGEDPPVVSDRVPLPVHYHTVSVPRSGTTAGAYVLVLQSAVRQREVRIHRPLLAEVPAPDRRHVLHLCRRPARYHRQSRSNRREHLPPRDTLRRSPRPPSPRRRHRADKARHRRCPPQQQQLSPSSR
mmetsp:Transcript_7756/g.23470  ORF Transcript_7756/g.23470 Transcript_7756/m.23470 type:complete len:343 (-) Transcript_7756:96-1124(-)